MSRFQSWRPFCAVAALATGGTAILAVSDAWAVDPSCRVVEVRYNPAGFPARSGGREELSPQVAVWVESTDGKFRKDLYLTRAVGLLGIGNRPGRAVLKSDFRWPYGRRPSSLPVWAHRRGKTYGYVVMGGACSQRYNPDNPRDSTCPNDFTGDPSDDDTTIAYHYPVSSTENYFCSPSGKKTQNIGGVDVVSCASSFYGSKGWYAPGHTSVYPPRADLQVRGGSDNADVLRFAGDNDVAAVSAATPPNGKVVDPIRWYTTAEIPDGNYVMWVEANIEGDFNAYYPPGVCKPEPHAEWDKLGQDYIGQPSVVYQVPFLLDQSGRIATTANYAGYGDRVGASGTLNPPDSTISQGGGSGADRLKAVTDENGTWRVKVSVSPCDPNSCEMPAAPAAIEISEQTDATLTLRFDVPTGAPAASYQVRYQTGMPVTADNWDRALPGPATNLGPPGSKVSSRLIGLSAKTKYYIGVRPINRCGIAGPVATVEADTQSAQFYTLHGCFVATAAYGSDMAPEVALLRRFRDERMVHSPLGQLAVASYYALSPSLSTVIADSDELRSLSRDALRPIVGAVRGLLGIPTARGAARCN